MTQPNLVYSSRKGSRKSDESIVFEHRDEIESVSPTSGPSLDFNNPWEGDRLSTTSRRKPKSMIGEAESIRPAKTGNIRSSKRSLPRELDLDEETEEEEIEVHEELSGPRSSTRSLHKDIPDAVSEWSLVHAPHTEAVEMSGALNIVEVAPRGAIDEEIDRKVAVQVSKDQRDERWTEITKDLVVREAIERLGYEYEETRTFYYIFSYLEPVSQVNPSLLAIPNLAYRRTLMKSLNCLIGSGQLDGGVFVKCIVSELYRRLDPGLSWIGCRLGRAWLRRGG